MDRPNEESSPRKAAVTRADVARYARVSTAVVSYVINDGPRAVSEATAARVRDAIERLGYRPNSTARALAVGSTKTIGLVVPDSTNAFFAEYALEVQRSAANLGYALLITNSGFDPRIGFRSVLDMCDRQIDGLILARSAGVTIGDLTRRGVRTPVVLIDSAGPLPGNTTVGSDSVGGAAAAIEHLLLVHQHPSVALIIGVEVADAVDGREHSWTEVHARHRRALGILERTDFTREGGYAAGMRLLQRPDRPAAVFTSSDLQAVGLLRAAHELGLSVPEDLAVASFDGTQESAYSYPPLTTGHQPTGAMAEAAVNAVLRPVPQPTHQAFPMDLIIRASCGCPPQPLHDNQTRKRSPS